MIQVGRYSEYVEAAKAECEGFSREKLLKRIAALMRECDTHVNRIESWRMYAGKLEREMHFGYRPPFRPESSTD